MTSATIPWHAALEHLESRLTLRPRTAVVLGSGLGDFARELENRVRRAVIMSEGKRLTPEDLELAELATRPHPALLKEAREALERDMVQHA